MPAMQKSTCYHSVGDQYLTNCVPSLTIYNIGFFMQTPNDSWPFCSLIAKTNKPHKPDSDSHSDTDSDTDSDNSWARPFTAILISSDVPIPNHLPALVSSYVAPNSFEGTDAPMIFLPLGFLIHHVRLFSTKLADLTETVSFIEKEVIDANDEADTKNLIKKLHICNRNAAELQRRWHFQLSLSSAIVDLLDHEFHDLRAQNHIRSYESHNRLKNAAALQRKISESLKYDLDAIPKRITNQFNAVSTPSFSSTVYAEERRYSIFLHSETLKRA